MLDPRSYATLRCTQSRALEAAELDAGLLPSPPEIMWTHKCLKELFMQPRVFNANTKTTAMIYITITHTSGIGVTLYQISENYDATHRK
jgi:hypothetical protein